MTIRVGFFGAGLISEIHCWFLASAGVDHRIVAVCDPDAARAADWAARHGAEVHDEAGLLAGVDAVYVCTWTSEHARLVDAAAAAGRAVFCEKPLAFDAGAATAMAAAVERAGVVNQVGLVLRFLPTFRLLRHLVADDRAGQVMAVVFRDDQFIPVQGHYSSTWRADPDRAGRGTLLEHSIHDVDVLQWIFGPVRSVSGAVREFHGLPGIDDVAAARLDFDSGATATLTSVWHDVLERPSLRRVEVFCERLHVAVEGDFAGPLRWQFTGEPEQVLDGDALAAALTGRGDRADNPAREFLSAVRDGRPASPDLAAALPAHRLVDAIYASAAAGGTPVEIAPAPASGADGGANPYDPGSTNRGVPS